MSDYILTTYVILILNVIASVPTPIADLLANM